MIPDFKTYIGESVWSDIQDRSAGDTVRQEDSIDSLDEFGLVEYIKKHYKNIGKSCFSILRQYDNSIWIGLEDIGGYYQFLYFVLEPVEGDTMTYFPYIELYGGSRNIPYEIKDELDKNFTIKQRKNEPGETSLIIEPKGSSHFKIKNSFFLTVLDTILKKMNYHDKTN